MLYFLFHRLSRFRILLFITIFQLDRFPTSLTNYYYPSSVPIQHVAYNFSSPSFACSVSLHNLYYFCTGVFSTSFLRSCCSSPNVTVLRYYNQILFLIGGLPPLHGTPCTLLPSLRLEDIIPFDVHHFHINKKLTCCTWSFNSHITLFECFWLTGFKF